MWVSESKRGLEKCPVHAGFVYAMAAIAILALECRVIRNIVPDTKNRTVKIQHIHQRRIVRRLVNILVPIIRFPFALLPRQPVCQLNIERLAVPGVAGGFVAMMD